MYYNALSALPGNLAVLALEEPGLFERRARGVPRPAMPKRKAPPAVPCERCAHEVEYYEGVLAERRRLRSCDYLLCAECDSREPSALRDEC